MKRASSSPTPRFFETTLPVQRFSQFGRVFCKKGSMPRNLFCNLLASAAIFLCSFVHRQRSAQCPCRARKHCSQEPGVPQLHQEARTCLPVPSRTANACWRELAERDARLCKKGHRSGASGDLFFSQGTCRPDGQHVDRQDRQGTECPFSAQQRHFQRSPAPCRATNEGLTEFLRGWHAGGFGFSAPSDNPLRRPNPLQAGQKRTRGAKVGLQALH